MSWTPSWADEHVTATLSEGVDSTLSSFKDFGVRSLLGFGGTGLVIEGSPM